MKKLAVILFAALIGFSSCSYEPGVSEAFTKYRFKDGVTTITVPGWVINLAAGLGDLEESEREILESIDKVKVLAVEDDDLNARIDLHEEFYNHINRKGNYEELLVVRNKDENVTIFGKMDESVIEEMVILVGGDDNAMIYIKGEIRPELINDQINITDPNKFLSFDF
ncbi:MAG: DUF4252 domain-containing protein [Bacteroidota bacterium]